MNEPQTSRMDGMPTRSDLMKLALDARQSLVMEAKRYVGSQDDAEDVVQELFLMLSHYQGSMPQNPDGWFVQVIRRRALDCLRRKINRKLVAEVEVPRSRESLQMSLNDVRGALAKLNEPYRSAIKLRYLEGRTFAELAQSLDSRERTARTWVARGLAALRETLGGQKS